MPSVRVSAIFRAAAYDIPAAGVALGGRAVGRASLALVDAALASPYAEAAVQHVFESPLTERTLERALRGDLVEVVARDLVRFEVVERLTDEMLTNGVLDRALDRAEAAGLPQQVAERLLADGIAEQIAARLLGGPELERIVDSALENPAVERIVGQIVESRLLDEAVARVIDDTAASLPASDALWALIDVIAQSPAVTEAITQQGAGFADQVAGEMRKRSRDVDARLERGAWRLLRRRARPRPAGEEAPSAPGAT